MNGLLSIASGLVGVYIILALITAHFAEAFAALVNKRGTALYDGLKALLGDATAVAAAGGTTTKLVDAVYTHALIGGPGIPARKPSYIPTRSLSLALVDAFRKLTQGATHQVDPADAPAALLTDLQNDLSALQSTSGAARSIAQVLQTARSDYQSALKAMDDWFQNQMDRISGEYRRWSSIVQALIAAVIVIFLNADTLSIVSQMSSSAVVASALASNNPATASSVQSELNTLATSGLKLGWGEDTFVAVTPGKALRKFAGLLVTWAAVLLGAPFWFDLLKQIAPIRLTGAKPDDPSAPGNDAQQKTS